METEKSKLETYGDVFTAQKSASKWDDLYKNPSNLFSHNMAVRRDRICKFVVDHYDPETKILDLGCGAGVVMEPLIEKGFVMTGADRSQDMLDLSQQRLSRFPKEQYELHLGTCESLPFQDEQFDIILCVGVFGYIDDVVGALLEIRRVLRPGGVLLMSVRNPFNLILSDPVRTAKFVSKKVGGGLFGAKKPVPITSLSSENEDSTGSISQRPPQFRVDILQNPRPLINGVIQCGYKLEHFSGFGFGPFSVAGKSIFPRRWSIKISDFLNCAFDRLGLKFITRSIGDVSIYAFRKVD